MTRPAVEDRKEFYTKALAEMKRIRESEKSMPVTCLQCQKPVSGSIPVFCSSDCQDAYYWVRRLNRG